jgi:DNA primase
MDWVSFDEIKKTVSLQMVIEHYRVPLRHAGPNTLRGKCPLPTHSSKNSTESFTATLSKGVGGAWACQSQSCIKARGRVGGNVLDFVAAMERCSVRDAAIKLQMWFLVPAAGEPHRPASKGPHTELSVGKEPDVISKIKGDEVCEDGTNKPLSFTLQKIECGHPYVIERGLTEEIARKFGVGIFPGKGSMQGRCVIPIHNRDGELVAYVGRAIDGSEPRYKFPTGFRKSLELFNLHRVIGEPSVVVVEGFFDCMKVSQAGYPCVALMGSTMSDAQEQLIAEYFGSVILMFDGDDAGRSATEEISDRLQRVVFQVKTIELDQGVQPDKLSSDELRKELDAMAC